jgi:hypothetical protein
VWITLDFGEDEERHTLSHVTCRIRHIFRRQLVGVSSVHTFSPGILVLRICLTEIVAQMGNDKFQGLPLQYIHNCGKLKITYTVNQ